MSVSFGLAIKNFVGPTETPDVDAIVAYAERAEQLGFESLWAWDHVILGVEPAFPIIDALSMLTAIAMRTTRIKLGTGILVLPLRNPTVLAKQIGSIDHISKGRFILGTAVGWYAREFGAVGVPFKQRGKIMDRNLEILTRLLTEDRVRLKVDEFDLRDARVLPRPVQQPRPPILIGGYVDAVFRRIARYGDGWLTYFYTPESFQRTWERIKGFTAEAGRDPATPDGHEPARHLRRGRSRGDAPLAGDGVGHRELERVDARPRHPGLAGRVRRAAQGPRGERRRPPDPDSLPLPARAGRDHREGDPAAGAGKIPPSATREAGSRTETSGAGRIRRHRRRVPRLEVPAVSPGGRAADAAGPAGRRARPSVLDLACGEGFYSRIVRRLGAARVHGVDLSPEMVRLAEEAERQEPLGCTYSVGDARLAPGALGQFDVVMAVYLLNYAQTADELHEMARSIAGQLAPGGRLVGINDNPRNAVERYGPLPGTISSAR